MPKRRYYRRETLEDEVYRGLLGISFLFVGYLALLYYTNRTEFWTWLTYGIIAFVAIIGCGLLFAFALGRLRRKRFDGLLATIRRNQLDDEVKNFITRFGRGQERAKDAWEYRGYKIDWNRINEVMSEFERRGARLTHKEFSAILKHYIDERESDFTLKSIQSSLRDFNTLNGSSFESLLQRLYESMGYTVQLTGRTGDQGGDLVAIKGQERLLIQAKCYKNATVGNDAVQQAVAAMKYYDCNKAAVATTSEFTRSAIELARANGVDLIPKQHLQELLLEHLSESWK